MRSFLYLRLKKYDGSHNVIVSGLLDDAVRVGPAEAEGTDARTEDGGFPLLHLRRQDRREVCQLDVWVERLQVQVHGDAPVSHRVNDFGESRDPCRSLRVPDVGLHCTKDERLLRTPALTKIRSGQNRSCTHTSSYHAESCWAALARLIFKTIRGSPLSKTFVGVSSRKLKQFQNWNARPQRYLRIVNESLYYGMFSSNRVWYNRERTLQNCSGKGRAAVAVVQTCFPIYAGPCRTRSPMPASRWDHRALSQSRGTRPVQHYRRTQPMKRAQASTRSRSLRTVFRTQIWCNW